MRKIITGQFSDSIPPIMDGVGRVAQNYFYYLNKSHGHSYLIGPQVPDFNEDKESIIRYKSMEIPFFSPYRIGFPLLGDFRGNLESINFDIIHSHSPFTAGKEALRLANLKNIPIVTTFHSKYKDDFLRALKSQKISEQLVHHIIHYYEEVDAVWVPNEPTKETLISYGFKGKIEIARNGTEMKPLDEHTLGTMKKTGRAKHGYKEDEIILLYVGQLRKEKNLLLLIEGLSQLIARNIPIKALFVGTGPDEDELKRIVKKKDLQGYISFPGLIRDRDELQTYYALSNLFIFPSLYDNQSVSMREAAACAVPSLCVKGASTAEGIDDGENGFLIENSVSSFVKKIEYLMNNISLIQEAGKHAQKTIYESYETIVEEVYHRYMEIIDAKKRK